MQDLVKRYRGRPQTTTKRFFTTNGIALGAPLRGSDTLFQGSMGTVPLVLKKLDHSEWVAYTAVENAAVHSVAPLTHLSDFTLFDADSPQSSPSNPVASASTSPIRTVNAFKGCSVARTPINPPTGNVAVSTPSPSTITRHWASMPYYSTTLESIGRPLDDTSAVKLVSQMTIALSILHGKNLAHMDVKPSNIFVDSQGSFFLGDFGSVATIGRVASSTTWAFVPSDVVQSPSLLASANHDWWMLGMTVTDMLTTVAENEVGHGASDPDCDAVLNQLRRLDAVESLISRLESQPLCVSAVAEAVAQTTIDDCDDDVVDTTAL
jgi:serine/threonine protein kinase